MQKRNIINQCGAPMALHNYAQHGAAYFTATYNGDAILGIECIKGSPQTINLSHPGAEEAVRRAFGLVRATTCN